MGAWDNFPSKVLFLTLIFSLMNCIRGNIVKAARGYENRVARGDLVVEY